ncbi:MAG: DUF4350 domain-containing protein [Alteromonadaceae bacterium]|nr:DUF4350 domain-containing protein [Alteromonadaceae bacterium]
MVMGICIISISINAQQVGSSDFVPVNSKKTFLESEAPTVLIDEAHHNFHTMDGRYQPFAKILQSDGYNVDKNTKLFSKDSLKNVDVLVISNALNSKNTKSWNLPNYSAFKREEIEAVYHWVKNGGSLFLIADHMPFPKASESLAAVFGFQFNNGYAKDKTNKNSIFKYSEGALTNHVIRKGMNDKETIDYVRTFTGQAFLSPPNAEALLILGDEAVTYMPSKSWKFNDNTPEFSVSGWSQGATLEFYKGRVVVFGEAAMFTAQLAGKAKRKMGVIGKGAEQNEQFLLNIMHWLSKKI